ncbi:MAG: hypothetical protein R3B99_16125 [Polyangiales bacterium]
MNEPIPSPVDVARAMVARGAFREAEIVLRGALARGGHDGDAHFALATLERGGSLPPGATPTLDLELVDRWIREGWLVEASALLAGVDLGQLAEEWSNLLGELLSPVPAHAEEALVHMHRELLSGGASVALAILEDRLREGALPGWAERRLALLRWMLLDNAGSAPDDDAPTGMAPSALAAVLRVPLAQRNLEGVHEAAEAYARSRPDDVDARALLPMTALLAREMTTQLQTELTGFQTVPVAGRPAAAMQLRMGNLDGATSIYRSLASKSPGDSLLQQLFDAVRGLQRVLEGRPVVDRSFAPPPRETTREKVDFDDHTENESVDEMREPTRMVDNPLLVFEEETAVRPSDEILVPPTTISAPPSPPDDDDDEATRALPRDEVERVIGQAKGRVVGRGPRPTMPFGSRPPPPPDVPRTEAEMNSADDPDPTMLGGPPPVVVHAIRPIGVGGKGDDS